RLKSEARLHLVDARPGRWFGSATGGDQQRVVLQLLAAIGVHRLLARVDRGRPGLEVDLDVPLGRLLDGAHEDFLAPDLAAQVTRQGDAVVKRVALRRDDGDLRVLVSLAQVLCTGLAGDPVAEDDVATRQLQGERVDVTGPLGIEQIVSGGFQVPLRRMPRREVHRDVPQAIGVRLETQGHEQLPQCSARAREDHDGDVHPPRLAQQSECATARSNPYQSVAREAFDLLRVEVARTVHIRTHAGVKLIALAPRKRRPERGRLGRAGYAGRLPTLDPETPAPPASPRAA